MERLLGCRGTSTHELPDLVAERLGIAEPSAGAEGCLRAAIVYAASHEVTLHLDDILTRRTRISMETSQRGVEVVDA